ncbi:MAG: 6-bladed beta-propeller [Balneolaceae bacterium]|nr:6-bladed beta-propeller [Balneolaceae bacterium]
MIRVLIKRGISNIPLSYCLTNTNEMVLRFLTCLIILVFLVQCSENSIPQKLESIRILDEIPQHIQEVENLTIFPGDSKPQYSIDLIPKQTYGETDEPYVTKVNRCIVDDKGRVIIWDSNLDSREFPFINRLYVFDNDGTYHTQIGGPGKGPGEYGMIIDVQTKAGKVFVTDFTSMRLNVYTTSDYSIEQSTLIERWEVRDYKAVRGMEFGAIKARDDGNFIVSFYEPSSDNNMVTYLLMDAKGNALSFDPLQFPSSPSIRVPNKPLRPSMSLSFMGFTIIDVSGKDELYSVWTRDFLIKKYDTQGVYQSAIYYPIQGPPFDLNAYAKTDPLSYNPRVVERAFDDMDEELPETNPVIAGMMVDDENRIWVVVPTDGRHETYEWWILKASGELLAKLLLPRDQPIYDIKNDYLYSKKMNEETGTEYVVKYRIEWTEKE